MRERSLVPALIIGVAVATILTAIARGDQTESGNDWLDFCERALSDSPPLSADEAKALACLGFVHASYYTAMIVRDLAGNPNSVGFCGKAGIPNGQLARIFVKYLQDHPERLHHPAAFLAYEAWQSAFPCTSS